MPEVICLISSSPPQAPWHSRTPPPAKKPRNGAAKLIAVTATFDLTGDTPAPAPKTKKTYVESTFSAAAPHNGASNSHQLSSKAQMPTSATTTSDTNAKMNDKEFVFVDDDDGYSSGMDLSKEYSLHLSQLKERAGARIAAAQVEGNAPASRPIAENTSNSEKPIEKPIYKTPIQAATRKILPKPVAQASYRSPVTALKTALNKPSGMVNKEYVFLDDDFSSSIDLDKEYDLGLPALKMRKVSPDPETYKMSGREKEKHELPGLCSSPDLRSTETIAKRKEVEKHGLPDLSSSPSSMRREVADVKGVEKHGLRDLFSSPRTKQKKAARPAREIVKHSLPDFFSPPPKRKKWTQAQVDAATMKAVVGKSTAPQVTINEASLPDPFNPSPKPVMSKQGQINAATMKTFMAKTTAPEVPTTEASLPQPLKRRQDRVLDSDPITFTSSPDFAQMEKDSRKHREQALAKSKQISDIDEPAPKASNMSVALEALDSDSDELPELPSLTAAARILSRTKSDTSYLKTTPGTAPPRSKTLARSKSMADPTAKPKKRVPKTDDEKAAEKADKEAAKEAEAERKRLLRDEKARDKIIAQDLAKVNTLKTDKKKSTPEMIVLFPQEMDKKLRETAEGFLAKLSVEYRNWTGAGATPGEVAGSGMVKNVVRWKRKVDAVHNEREDIWEPVPRRIENEKHVLVHLLAKEFVELATADGDEDLNEHALKLKSRFYDHKVIYLIEGLSSWQKKNANLRNRQFAAAVRAQAVEEALSSSQTTTASRSRKKKPPPEYISDDLIEDALISLQIKHRVLIHHTASLVESAEWISIFTQHISTIPYRLQKMNLDTSFCMESGQVRAGEDARDTFVKMLCEMRGVTAPVGWGVEAEIGGGVKQLVERFKMEGKEALATAKKGANRDGAFTDRNVGRAISKRIHNVFMGTDPASTDV